MLGLFIFLFLFLFEPFGLSQVGDSIGLFSFYFALATMLISLGADLFIDHVLRIDRQSDSWTFGKWLISALVIIVLIALANYYILSMIYNNLNFRLNQFLMIGYTTLLVGMFPIGFFGFLHLNTLKRKNASFAQNIKLPESQNIPEQLELESKSDGKFTIDKSEFLYAEAMQNYVAIYYLKNEEILKKVFRITLKELEKAISSDQILKCHRSYMVNLNNIDEVRGNAQGLRLHVRHSKAVIPVSRSYINRFR